MSSLVPSLKTSYMHRNIEHADIVRIGMVLLLWYNSATE